MKQVATLFFFLVSSVIAFSQELTTNKAETVALLATEFKLANGQTTKDPDGILTLTDCQLSFEKGMLSIKQSLLLNNAFYSARSYHFSPIDIDVIANGSRDHAREKDNTVGDMRIYVNSGKVLVKSRSLPENKEEIMWHNSTVSLSFFYDNGKAFAKLENALLHLKKLLQAEADPFELTADEKKLSALFAKYKYMETSTKPTEYTSGKKIKVEDILLTLKGPTASYFKKQSTTRMQNDDEVRNGQPKQEITEAYSYYSEFWWRNIVSLKFHTVTGALTIKAKGEDFTYKTINLKSNQVTKTKGISILTVFKPGPADTNGEAKKDILEMMSLIKKIVKLYDGGDVVSEILDN